MNQAGMDIWDLLYTPMLLILLYIIILTYSRLRGGFLVKKYLVAAITVRLIGSISLGMIYQFYYTGGDTVNYFSTSTAILNVFSKSPSVFFDVMLGGNTHENRSFFDESTFYKTTPKIGDDIQIAHSSPQFEYFPPNGRIGDCSHQYSIHFVIYCISNSLYPYHISYSRVTTYTVCCTAFNGISSC